MTSLGPLEILSLAAFLGLLCGFAGGVGGRKLFERAIHRDLDEHGADLAAFSERLKSLEGRSAQNRRKEREANAPSADAALLQQLLAARAPGGAPKAAPVLVPDEEFDELEATRKARHLLDRGAK